MKPGRSFALACWLLSSLGTLGACNQQIEAAPHAQGTAGESCEVPADCQAGLTCADFVCANAQGAARPSDAGPVPASFAREGEPCSRRADCSPGLSCLRDRCLQSLSDLDGGVLGPARGGPGESCAASSDCEPELGCVGGLCRIRDLGLKKNAKECFSVECSEDDDCCENFVPPDMQLCSDLYTSCKLGAVADCNLWGNICKCQRACQDSLCVSSVTCDNDQDCGGSGVLKCFAGYCVQCAVNADCGSYGVCMSGFCRGGCTRNEQCPFLHACQDARCVEVGCQGDRECAFLTKNPISRCTEGECVAPCEYDSQCLQPMHGCVKGICAFVGCESDLECREALELVDTEPASIERAVCRVPKP